MEWKKLLEAETAYAYAVTENMFNLVSDDELGWKPSSENNWMTVGQLLMHITEACGMCFKGFVTGDWGMPDGMDEAGDGELMLPTAEQMKSVESVADAKNLLAADKAVAFDMLARCSEERLATENAPAPWDPGDLVLGWRLKQMIDHLHAHKTQLFFYLKLQGKPVNTETLWGV